MTIPFQNPNKGLIFYHFSEESLEKRTKFVCWITVFTRVPALELPKELVLVKTLMLVTGIEFLYLVVQLLDS